jgi:FixJ family two-component response regulator
MSSPSTVFIVDDDEAVRDALSLLLRTAGYQVKTFESAQQFLSLYRRDWQGCAVLDVVMPNQSGLDLQKEMRARDIRMPVLFLTAHGNIPTAVRTIKAGAWDFLTKPVDGNVLINRIQEALDHQAQSEQSATSDRSFPERLRNLTEREREIMALMIEGLTSKEIARRLGISHRTVDIHRSHVMAKTGASNLLELARLAESSK